MKTLPEIEKMSQDMKDALVDASGDSVQQIQGFLRALRWVTLEEKEEEE